MKKYIVKYWHILAIWLFVALLPFNSINPKPESISHELLFPTSYTVQVIDSKGKIVSNYTRKSDSYVLGFLDILACNFRSVSSTVVPDTANTPHTVAANTIDFAISAAASDDTLGIVIGTGTNAVALADYALQTKILTGTSAGKLSYALLSTTAPTTSGNSRLFTITRAFTNNSGGSITVNEIGLYGYASSSYWIICLIRDTIGGGQAVAAGSTLTITYTISISV